MIHLSDEPFEESYLRTKIIGRVIGLYQPTFEEAKLKPVERR